MPPPVKKRPFPSRNPFFISDIATGKEKGHHGLWLAVSKEIIAAHRSTLAVTDRPVGRAAFLVTLPLE